MKIAVVGAGIHGSFIALELADRGHTVTLFEQFGFEESRGSSKGRSRIVRKAYPDTFHTALLQDGHPMWTQFQERLGQQIYHETGLLYFGSRDSAHLRDCVSALNEVGVEHQILDAAQVEGRWGAPHLAQSDYGIFTPEAGWVRADLALAGARSLAANQGAALVNQKVESLEELSRFDRVVITAGSWVNELHTLPVTIKRLTYAHIEGEYHGPVFIEDNEVFPYGFPTEPGRSDFKIGIHLTRCEPDGSPEDFEADNLGLDQVRDAAKRRFGIAEPHLSMATGCPYTMTEDELFRVKWIDPSTLVISACSGHGFKFGPWMGRFASDLLDGEADLRSWPQFAC
jgi:glycine/D-amino acid oxidase-like deaminating enzyme